MDLIDESKHICELLSTMDNQFSTNILFQITYIHNNNVSVAVLLCTEKTYIIFPIIPQYIRI